MLEIQALTGREQFVEVRLLERTVWGFSDSDVMPLAWYVITTKAGGQAFGAYDGARMVGFCSAMAGIKPDGMAFLHSHTLGVLPEYRDRGVGRALKLAQREDALARNIRLMEWTFDPLELKNAYFNLVKLGAVARRYRENQYGVTGSPLHGALPTDRLIAEWWVGSKRVERALAGAPAVCASVERVAIPEDVGAWRREQTPRAREAQLAAAQQFQAAFARGLAATAIEPQGAERHYLLEPWNED